MSQRTKDQLKAGLIAALVGAAMTFLSSLLQSLGQIDFGTTDNVIAGGGSAVAYMKVIGRTLV